MIDVKKLISGFLILAVAAVCSGVILSFLATSASGTTAAQAGPTIAELGGSQGNTVPTFGTSAFVDTGSLQGNAAEILNEMGTPTTTVAASDDADNLTNTFAESFLNGLVAANPDGVTTDQDGNLDFNAPDTDAVAQALASDPTFQGFQAPDWDTQAAQVKVITAANTSANVDNYVLAVNNVYNQYIGNSDIGGVLGEENSADAQSIATQLQTELQTLEAIPTPTSLMPVQESFIKLLVYEENSVQLIINAESDPLKSALIFQDEQSDFDLAISNFQSQWGTLANEINAQESLLPPPSGMDTAYAFVDHIFGIPTANAQLIVHDPAVFSVVTGQLSVSTSQLGKTIEKYVEDIALQILINTLSNLIQRKVLTWIQGSGAPRFVTDFGTQMVNSFQTAAVSALNQEMQCVPSYQAPFARLLLTTPAVQNNNSCGAEFNSQLNNNLQNLYNHFTNINDYLALYQSNGWSAVIQVQNAAMTAGANNAQANQTQNIAQQGWNGSATCPVGDGDPNGSHYTCPDGGTLSGNMCNMGSGLIPENAILVQNNGLCNDGTNPKITSPGQATGQGFFSSIQGGPTSLTSAKNLAGILNALLSSVLNTLAQDAINYSNQELNNLENGGSGGGGDSGILGISSSSLNLSSSSSTGEGIECIPADQAAEYDASTSQASASFSAAGGTIDATCAASNDCPSNVNSDGTPIYSWSAPGSLQTSNGTATGDSFFDTYTTTGTYYVTVTASTDGSTSTCEVDVQ